MSGSQQLLLAVGGSGLEVPTYTFSNVDLLVHGDSRPFVDASTAKRGVCNWAARCTLSSSRIAVGSANGGLMVFGSDATWQFGVGSWFVSANVEASTYASAAVIFDTRPTVASSNGWCVDVDTSRRPRITIEGTTYGTGTPAANLLANSSAPTTISFSYDGTDLRCFVDGALSWAHTVALNINTGSELIIGNNGDTGQPAAAGNTALRLKELLVISGEAVATEAFAVPGTWSDTGIVLEAWNPATYSNVKLNCHMSGTNGGTTFSDTSTGAKAITRNGNAQTSTAQARIGSSSGLFDGTGDFLTLADSADWDFGTADFSIEMQIRPANITARQILLSNYQNATTGFTLQTNLTTNGRVHFNATGDGSELDTGNITGSSYLPITATTWQHVMLARASGFLQFFYEGELTLAVADTTNITGSTASLYFGRLTTVSTTVDFNGYAQELRVVKGEACNRSFSLQSAAHPDS